VVGETEPFDLTDPEIPEDWLFNAWYTNNLIYQDNGFGNKITHIDEATAISLAGNGTTITIYGYRYPKPVFWMTTTPMNAGEKFAFTTRIVGDVWVDWGDGYIAKIKAKPNWTWIHNYKNSGTYKIGVVSKNITDYDRSNNSTYDSEDSCAAHIYSSFYITNCWTDGDQGTTPLKLAKIEGKLGDVLPTLSNGKNANFTNAFCGCENLTGSIPDGFFDKITGQPTLMMFWGTFDSTKLSGNIPDGLFAGLNGTYTGSLFEATFSNTKLSGPIPQNLFGNLHGTPQKCMFASTFWNASNINGPIPENLFGNLNGAPALQMFSSTFNNCTNLTGPIPENLFGNLNGAPAPYMFAATFSGCSGLSGSIPENLFGNINGAPAPYMFSSTFWNASNINGPIPENLFGNLHGAPAARMFTNTFDGTSVSGPIPQNLFRNISGPAQPWMYNRTFALCSGLTGNITEGFFGNITEGPIQEYTYNRTFMGASGLTGPIPENLFGNVTGTALRAFYETFKDATNIGKDDTTGEATPIPVGLFKSISGPANATNMMFSGMFQNTQYLTAPVPTELFKGITGYLSDNSAGNRTATYTAGGMANIFNNSNISTVCDAGQYQYLTGFEADWGGHVACEMCPVEYPDSVSGDNVTMKKCFTDCPVDENGGEYVSGHKYWTEDEEHIGDISSCVYKYNISYELNGADESLNSSNPTEYLSNIDSDLIISAPAEREFFTFIGWYDNAEFTGDAITNIPVGSVGNKKLYAKWDADVFNITYELDGGENYENAPASYTADSETITFGTPTKEGYNFVHWLDENGDVITEIPHGSNGDKTLTAVWAREIHIHFDTNSGADIVSNVPDDIVCVNGEACEIFWTQIGDNVDVAPARNAYSFNGWNQFADGNGYNFIYVADPDAVDVIEHTADLSHVFNLTQEQNITLHAQWTPDIFYIHYELGGGENYENAPNEYTVESDTITFGTPTKEGYNFIQWMDEKGNVITELPTG
ncbi:MAG: InlB B-repeat-containing protein, partial [Alphaproteobacteria bacterium]|nr:InlB B-repeat-containing protein [Alphaproteobacteria bacterium]